MNCSRLSRNSRIRLSDLHSHRRRRCHRLRNVITLVILILRLLGYLLKASRSSKCTCNLCVCENTVENEHTDLVKQLFMTSRKDFKRLVGSPKTILYCKKKKTKIIRNVTPIQMLDFNMKYGLLSNLEDVEIMTTLLTSKIYRLSYHDIHLTHVNY